MEDITFDQLRIVEEIPGQRIEVEVQVGKESVARILEGYEKLLSRIEGLVSEQIEEGAAQDYLLNVCCMAALRKMSLESAVPPSVHVAQPLDPEQDFRFTFVIVPMPVLFLENTDPVTLSDPAVVVNSEDVDEQIAFIAESNATLRPISRTMLHSGDWAVMDVELSINGKIDKQLSGVRRTVEVLPGSVPSGFLKGVEGLSVGEMKKFSFDLGDPSRNRSDIEGAQRADRCSVTVTLHELREKCIPTIDDEWVFENFPQCGTYQGLREFLKRDLEEQGERVARQNLVFSARSAIEKRLVGDIPDEMYELAKEKLYQQTVDELLRQGTNLEEYCESHAIAKEVFMMNTFLQASELLRQDLALDQYARQAGIEISEVELAKAKSQMSPVVSALSDEDFAVRGYLSSLKNNLMRQKALETIIGTAVYV